MGPLGVPFRAKFSLPRRPLVGARAPGAPSAPPELCGGPQGGPRLTQEEREAGIVERGNAGANVPGEFAEKIDTAKAEALVKRGHKKNWMNMKTPIGWKPFWFEYNMPILTYHERPGADAKGSVSTENLQLSAGPTVAAEESSSLSPRLRTEKERPCSSSSSCT